MKHTTPLAIVSSALLLVASLPAAMQAQATVTTEHDHTTYNFHGDGPAILVHQDAATVERDGAWNRGDVLTAYADQHPGTYILSLQNGSLRRLDDAHAVAQIAALRAPMDALSAQQSALSAQMKPLSAQMKSLGEAMRSAPDPAGQTRLGEQMSALGKQMGAIGEQQGAVGRQQGKLGLAVHQRLLEIINACVSNNTCPAVSSPAA